MTLAVRDENPNGYEVQPYQHNPQPANARFLPAQQQQAQPPTPANGQMTLTDWAEQMAAAGQLANGLARTSFVPETFRGNVGEAAAAILTGYEMGLSPTASLRAIYVIKGTPAMYAKAMKAVLLAKGHEIWTVESSSTRVVVKGRRKGSDKVETSIWDTARVRLAEVDKSNANYRKNPQNMLQARATAEACWLTAPDALYGIGASVEETGEDPAGEYGAVTEQPVVDDTPAKRTAKRKPLERMESAEPDLGAIRAEATVEPPAPTEPDPATDADPQWTEPPAPEMVTRDQQKHMFKLWADLGFGGDENRENRLIITAKVLKLAEVGSSSDLTAEQASILIDALTARKNAPQPSGGEQS